MSITGIDHVALYVADIEATCAFYDRLFGIQVNIDYAPNGKSLVRQIKVGGAALSVHQHGNGITPVAINTAKGAVDMCFRWKGAVESAVALLKKHNVAIVEGPAPRKFSDGRPSQSVYFRDPDGNLMELMADDSM